MSTPDPSSPKTHDAAGPAVLVQTFVFAEQHILLMQRGFPPYRGKWAPPGGFVEPFESAEAAAMRETFEETGVQLDIERLLPLATASVSSINQIHLMFIAQLDIRAELQPMPPEAVDARWFPESAFPLADVWEPVARFDMSELFDRVRAGRFEFYQRTDEFHRVISEKQQVRYLRGSAAGFRRR
jgi:ADP-ribose pyrophosphatase YjhB (NUDIX family)